MTRPVVTLQGAGIDPTGTTSSTSGINALLDRHPGARFVAPTEAQFRLGAPVTIGAMGTILDLGTSTLLPDAGIAALSVRASNVVIEDGTITGKQHASFVPAEAGISIVGPSAAKAITGVLIAGTKISNFGAYGILLTHVRDFLLDTGVEVTDCYYGGIFGLSCINGYLRRPVVRRISASGAPNANAYGIAWSSIDESGDLVNSPMSSDIITQSPVVSDCTTWHGLDTHGGVRIQFLDIDVRRCYFPVAMNPGDGPGNVALVPPLDFVVTGVIDSERTDSTGFRAGLIVAGAWSGVGVLDESKLATGRVDVTIRGYGSMTADGAMWMQSTKDLDVTLRAERCSPIALGMIRDNYGFNVEVTAVDTWTTAATATFVVDASTRSQGTLASVEDRVTRGFTAPTVNSHSVRVAGSGTSVRLRHHSTTAGTPIIVNPPAVLTRGP